eukprot:366384-Chlamydomonas_euryale.AAC.13
MTKITCQVTCTSHAAVAAPHIRPCCSFGARTPPSWLLLLAWLGQGGWTSMLSKTGDVAAAHCMPHIACHTLQPHTAAEHCMPHTACRTLHAAHCSRTLQPHVPRSRPASASVWAGQDGQTLPCSAPAPDSPASAAGLDGRAQSVEPQLLTVLFGLLHGACNDHGHARVVRLAHALRRLVLA